MIIFLYSLSRFFFWYFLLLLQSMFVCLGLWPMCPKNVCRIAIYVAFLQIYELFSVSPNQFYTRAKLQSIKKLYRLYYISSPDFLWKFHCKKSINCLKQTRNGDKWGGEEVGLDPAPSEVWFLPFGALFALGQSAVINVSIEVGGARWLREQEGGRSW